MKRFIALVLSLVMALSLCAPAWGEDENAIADAIAAGETEITLGEGEFTLPNVKNKDITLIGAGVDKTVVDYSHMGGYQEVSGSSFVFKNMTIKCAEKGYPYPGLQHTTGVSYKNCHILGTVNLFCPATFKNCTFDSGNAEHNAVTYGSDSVTFEDCKFTYADRSINCYAENASSRDVAVTFINCEFTKVEGKDVTGAIETNSCFMKSLTLTITDCTVNDGDLWWVSTWDSNEGANTTTTVNYTVTFDANDGSTTESKLVPAGEYTLPENGFTAPEGMKFKGWATTKDATEVLGETYAVTGAVTFYAIWEEEECMGDSHVKVLVEYSGDVATKVYCDYCSMSFAFIQGTEDDAKDKFGEGNYVNAENDVWYTLKAQSGEVPSVPEVPPVEDDKTEGEEVAVTTPAEVDTVVNNTVIDAVKDSAETTVTVTTPVEGNADAETTIKFDSAEAKDAFVNATATDITTALTAVEEIVTDEVTAKVEEKVSDDAELAAYLDIDITVFADGDPVGEITQLPKEIKVVIPASALDFGDLEKNHTRKVSVIRFHDDQVDVIPAKLEADGSVSFYSHLFSTYAVVYEDVATSTNYPIYYWPVGDTTTTDEDVTSPKTFDAGVALYVGMSVAAAVGTVTLSKKRED